MTMTFEVPMKPGIEAEKSEAEFNKAANEQIATLREMVKSGELKTETAQAAARVAARGTEDVAHSDQV